MYDSTAKLEAKNARKLGYLQRIALMFHDIAISKGYRQTKEYANRKKKITKHVFHKRVLRLFIKDYNRSFSRLVFASIIHF